MWTLVDFLTGYTASFIYIFIFFGLFAGGLGAPVPEDLLLLIGGFLSWAGYTDLYLTIAISITGAVVGDYLVFYLGRKWGSNVLGHPRLSRWLTSHRLSRIHDHFDGFVRGRRQRSPRHPVRVFSERKDRQLTAHHSRGKDRRSCSISVSCFGLPSLQAAV